jgi:hypothetical protein
MGTNASGPQYQSQGVNDERIPALLLGVLSGE